MLKRGPTKSKLWFSNHNNIYYYHNYHYKFRSEISEKAEDQSINLFFRLISHSMPDLNHSLKMIQKLFEQIAFFASVFYNIVFFPVNFFISRLVCHIQRNFDRIDWNPILLNALTLGYQTWFRGPSFFFMVLKFIVNT